MTTTDNSLVLGASYEDAVTGYKGVAVGHARYLTGCSQVLLMPRVDAKGERRDGEWFDIQRLKRSAAKVIRLDNSKTPGPDRAAPKR